MLTLLSGAWWAARAVGAYGKARSLASGPFGSAIGVGLAAVVLVGALALGLAWLRHDAAGDAASAATAQCDVRQHQAALAAAHAESAALRRAAQDRDSEIELRRVQQELAEEEIARLERSMEKARDEARTSGSGRSIAIPADDWLRQRAGAASAAGAPAGR